MGGCSQQADKLKKSREWENIRSKQMSLRGHKSIVWAQSLRTDAYHSIIGILEKRFTKPDGANAEEVQFQRKPNEYI